MDPRGSSMWPTLAATGADSVSQPLRQLPAERFHVGLLLCRCGYPRRHIRALYRFRPGSFVAYRYKPDPSCDAKVMANLPKHRIRGARAACADGWGLVTGRQL